MTNTNTTTAVKLFTADAWSRVQAAAAANNITHRLARFGFEINTAGGYVAILADDWDMIAGVFVGFETPKGVRTLGTVDVTARDAGDKSFIRKQALRGYLAHLAK